MASDLVLGLRPRRRIKDTGDGGPVCKISKLKQFNFTSNFVIHKYVKGLILIYPLK